ncbi:MAG: GNAT family N-acetyltransferase [Kofleriaceae bacterium]|nr:GNAT family N-acetyltransferase [Kofleriaceae bacterium]
MKLQIRKAAQSDVATILGFVRELARYEKAEEEVVASEEMLRDSLFGKSPVAFALVCTMDEVAVGFALYFYNYSTWLGKKGLFLEDLYVSPSHRGQGAGLALFKHLAGIAREQDCGRMEWNVLDWNEPAIGFYKSLGAKPQEEWVGYRLRGNEIALLCESAAGPKSA